MTKKSSHRSAGRATEMQVIDPAAKYYDQSRRNREAYKKVLSSSNHESSWSDTYLAERHHPVLQEEGNSRSRSGFDFRTFRSKT